ncbi:MAG TPA: phosphocholine cytidylyltransferase family protein [Vicinamibacterales bacterium]|nr:phosphocholine cytidylyltransferase family protein [Vicinamibacterales bacterium]
MRAVILAAGLGSRMLPHTESRPKCLLKVNGHSIIEYQFAALRQCGITDVVIVLGHQGDKVRRHLDVPVTYVENREYASTGSSYSLWLTRDLIRDGFLYINSDLVFHPRMLEALLSSPHPDAIIVDRTVNLTGDMQKAQMDGERILQMSKNLPAELACAEVVGPARFSVEGARRLIAHLDDLIARGERSRWAYEVFGEIARRHPFMGVDNPGCLWAEVDTPADLIEANQRIPSHFVDFRAPRITTPDVPDHRRMWDINRQPIPYMDRLLNSSFARDVQAIPGAEDRLRDVLLANREKFGASLRTLGVRRSSAPAIHRAIAEHAAAIEAALGRLYDVGALASPGGLHELLRHVLRLCPEDHTGFVLRRERAVRLLEKLPPRNLMDALGHRSVASLLAHEDPLNVLAMCRTTEDETWQADYQQRLAKVTADDLETRPIGYYVADTVRYRPALLNSKHPPKLWRISHNKEAGVITCFTLDEWTRFRVPLLQYVLVFMHYFFETAFASRYYREVVQAGSTPPGEAIVASIYSHTNKLTFFYSNVYSENLFWEHALRLFVEAYDNEAARLLAGLAGCGEYVSSPGGQDVVVSLNPIDHVWNLNFLGHGVGIDTFEHDSIFFLYHFRGALWQTVVDALTGFDRDEMESLIVSNLGRGDAELTRRLLTARRPSIVQAEAGASLAAPR